MPEPYRIFSGYDDEFAEVYIETVVATEKELLEFANKIRKAGGANFLEALLPSVPGNNEQCLIARALNFSCRIDASSEKFDNGATIWHMQLPENMSKEQAEKIANEVGLEYVRDELAIMAYWVDVVHHFKLPEYIGNAAHAFDTGYYFGKFNLGSDD